MMAIDRRRVLSGISLLAALVAAPITLNTVKSMPVAGAVSSATRAEVSLVEKTVIVFREFLVATVVGGKGVVACVVGTGSWVSLTVWRPHRRLLLQQFSPS